MPLALVTGAGIRVGRAIALGLARDGFDVVLHANRSVDAAQAVKREVEALGRRAFVEPANLAEVTAVQALANRLRGAHGSVDLLVNSAAAYAHVDFVDITPAQLDEMFRVNLAAPFFLIQGLLPALRASTRAAIVNVTDMAVTHAYTTTHFFAHYLASKAALDQLTRSLALELGPTIRVNAVAPGPVAMAAETTEAQKADILGRIPLRREGSPEDIARAVVFLANAPYITGQTLRVDGGLSVA
ncbi:MAG: SDR family oxidoreductase [Myxococcaceae bacterium]|nr:SDR family oxidoreductase [Myxococcaceae bacterium]